MPASKESTDDNQSLEGFTTPKADFLSRDHTDAEISSLIEHTTASRLFLENHPDKSTPPWSAQEYFLHGLRNGLIARERGDYGIAACYVVRSGGVEVVSFGLNSLISEGNPFGHAEINSIKNAHQILLLPEEFREAKMREFMSKGEAKMAMRNAPHKGDETCIYTTLEPCPMCTVGAAINAKASEVIIAEPDPFAGALEDSRLRDLAPLWKGMADEHKLKVTFCQSKDERSGNNYLTPEHAKLLTDLFFMTKGDLDRHLELHGFFNPYKLIPVAVGLIGANNLELTDRLQFIDT